MPPVDTKTLEIERRLDKLESSLISNRTRENVQGEGTLRLHRSTLEVDTSARVSEILNRISSIESDIKELYGMKIDPDELFEGTIDSGNSTRVPLSSGASFTGKPRDISGYAAIGLMVYADVNSADDGLCVQFSFDGTNWHDGENYTIPADTTKFFTPPKQGKYYRVSFENNGTDQSDFHIHSFLSRTPVKWSSHNINSNLNDDDDSELVSSVLKLRTAQNSYVSGAATGNGNFKVSLEEADGEVQDGLTGSVSVIDREHHEIHEGDNYEVSDVVDLAINAVRDIRIITPNTSKHGHFIFRLDCESETEYYFYRGATVVTAGTSITPRNNDDNSSSTSSITVNYIDNASLALANADTIVAGAVSRRHGIIASGKSGGSVEHSREIILKQNETYDLRFIANAAGHVNYELSWYEHTAI